MSNDITQINKSQTIHWFNSASRGALSKYPWKNELTVSLWRNPSLTSCQPRNYLLFLGFSKKVGNEIFVIRIMQNYLHNTWWSLFLSRCEPFDVNYEILSLQWVNLYGQKSLLSIWKAGFWISPSLIMAIISGKYFLNKGTDFALVWMFSSTRYFFVLWLKLLSRQLSIFKFQQSHPTCQLILELLDADPNLSKPQLRMSKIDKRRRSYRLQQ